MVTPLARQLDKLESFHGVQSANWPTDPYPFLVWWHCGYPASDAACAKGWQALTARVGVDPERLLAAKPATLALALKAGGMVPELRALRLKEIAERVQNQFGGDLRAALTGRSVATIRAALRKFPGMGDPGVDRVLLFAGIAPVAAVPSNCPHAAVRMQFGREPLNYGRTYSAAQGIVEAEMPANFDSRTRAYLLLKVHGQQVCKRTHPKCELCPVAGECAFYAREARGR